MLARMWRNGNPLALLVGMQTGAATLENSVEVQKIKNTDYVNCSYFWTTDESKIFNTSSYNITDEEMLIILIDS